MMKIKWKNKFVFECVYIKFCLVSLYIGENESEVRLV